MAKKVYAIQYGFDFEKNLKVENIIVNAWGECLKYVKGVKGAKYKSFEQLADAEAYLNEGQRMLKKSDDNYPKNILHIYVDGSYNSASCRYSYGFAAVKNNIVEYIDGGACDSDENNNIRQIAGELKAAIKGVEYAVSQGYSEVVIFHDYEGIAHHATGAWQRKEASSQEYYKKMQGLMNTGIKIIFVKVDSHTGDLFNELADEKCKEQLGIMSDKVVEKYLKNNKIFVSNMKVKKQIQNLIDKNEENIIVGEDASIEDRIEINNKNDNIIENNSSKYEKIKDIYNSDQEQGKKLISKLLSKEKSEFIMYLLDESMPK